MFVAEPNECTRARPRLQLSCTVCTVHTEPWTLWEGEEEQTKCESYRQPSSLICWICWVGFAGFEAEAGPTEWNNLTEGFWSHCWIETVALPTLSLLMLVWASLLCWLCDTFHCTPVSDAGLWQERRETLSVQQGPQVHIYYPQDYPQDNIRVKTIAKST